MTDIDNTERIGGVAASNDDRRPGSDRAPEDLPSGTIHHDRSSANYNPDAAFIQNVLSAFEAFERGRR